MAQIQIDGVNYDILSDRPGDSSSGRRGYDIRTQPVDQYNVGVNRTIFWDLHGPIGLSSEGEGRYLAHDWGTLDTRKPDILQSGPELVPVQIAGGSPAEPVLAIHQDRGAIFAMRGREAVQIRPDRMERTSTRQQPAVITGAVIWYNKGYLAQGINHTIRRRVTVDANSATYEDVQVGGEDVHAHKMHVGANRLWVIHAGTTTIGGQLLADGHARQTFDDFASISNGFQPVPPGGGINGVGTLGARTFLGSNFGIYSFLENGQPNLVIDSLRGYPSIFNGEHFASLGGWLYTTSGLKLYAIQGEDGSPVGVGSSLMLGFTGWDGRPSAVHPWGEELLIAYKDWDHDRTHILRGVFNPSITGKTGHLDLYPYALLNGKDVRVISSTSLRAQPTVLIGVDHEIAYATRGRFSRDGGFWHGSRYYGNLNCIMSLVNVTFVPDDMEPGDSWQVAMDFDNKGYVDVGAAATEDGFTRRRPAVEAAAAGYTMKPRIVQTAQGANSATTPPKLRGKLTATYEERPRQAPVITVQVKKDYPLDHFLALTQDTKRRPVKVKLPDEENVTRYGFVRALGDVRDYAGDAVQSVGLAIVLWDPDG